MENKPNRFDLWKLTAIAGVVSWLVFLGWKGMQSPFGDAGRAPKPELNYAYRKIPELVYKYALSTDVYDFIEIVTEERERFFLLTARYRDVDALGNRTIKAIKFTVKADGGIKLEQVSFPKIEVANPEFLFFKETDL